MIKKVLIAGLAAVTLFSAGVLAGDVMFDDVSEDAWYYDAAMWAADNGLMTGNDGEFRGGDSVSRAELAEVFMRYDAMAMEEAEEEVEMECTTETVTDEETGEESEVETCVEVETDEEESTDEESTDEESTDEESTDSTEE